MTTDENGHYERNDRFNPPGWLTLTVDLKAKLLSPPDTTISGTIDVDAVDGDPRNDAKDFVLRIGEQISLGNWRIDGGDNDFMVKGQTSPTRPNTEVEIEVEVNIRL